MCLSTLCIQILTEPKCKRDAGTGPSKQRVISRRAGTSRAQNQLDAALRSGAGGAKLNKAVPKWSGVIHDGSRAAPVASQVPCGGGRPDARREYARDRG